MRIHELKLNKERKRKKRIGRGGKRGTYSGRGQKGQKSRSGRKIKSAAKEIILKFPKLRGSGNKLLKNNIKVIYVGQLEKFSENGQISKEILFKKGVIKNKNAKIKIIQGGEIEKPITVLDIKTSKGAKIKIEEVKGIVK